MLSSMTGFGRAVADTPFGRLVVEIQSVNRKYLEVSVALPREWGRFEHEVRKWVGETLARGSISVRISLAPNAKAVESFLPDLETLQGLKKGWDRLASQIGLDTRSVDLPFLVSQLPEAENHSADEALPALRHSVEEALKALVEMRRVEGKALARDLLQRLQVLEHELTEVDKLAPTVVAKMRQKLAERMAEVLPADTALDERLIREVALFAERVDITEEITRLRSHFSQLKGLLQTKEASVGRKMDFLVQEMGREINTIGSKCPETRVVEMKSELEKMREQIQNIE